MGTGPGLFQSQDARGPELRVVSARAIGQVPGTGDSHVVSSRLQAGKEVWIARVTRQTGSRECRRDDLAVGTKEREIGLEWAADIVRLDRKSYLPEVTGGRPSVN